MNDRAQAAFLGEIALADVAIDDHCAVFANSGQKRFDFCQRSILRFIEQHKSILPGPAAHDFERNHFDIASLEGDLIRGLADSFLYGLHNRLGPRRKLVFQCSWKISERASGYVRPRQDDLVYLPTSEKVSSMSGCDPGLASTGRPKNDYLRAAAQGIEIICLRRVKGLDRRKYAFVLEL